MTTRTGRPVPVSPSAPCQTERHDPLGHPGADGGYRGATVLWLDGRVKVERSAIHGLGLFCDRSDPESEVVEVLGGTTLTDSQVQAVIARGERYDGIALADDCNLCIEPPDWPGVHGNHSCDPNLWMRDEITVEARRDIRAGEELTADYALYTIAGWWSIAMMPAPAASVAEPSQATDWQAA